MESRLERRVGGRKEWPGRGGEEWEGAWGKGVKRTNCENRK